MPIDSCPSYLRHLACFVEAEAIPKTGPLGFEVRKIAFISSLVDGNTEKQDCKICELVNFRGAEILLPDKHRIISLSNKIVNHVRYNNRAHTLNFPKLSRVFEKSAKGPPILMY